MSRQERMEPRKETLESGYLGTSLVKMRRVSRVSTCLEAAKMKYQGKDRLSFLTLTSAKQSTRPLKKAWDMFYKIVKRYGNRGHFETRMKMAFGKYPVEYDVWIPNPYDWQYSKVKTEEGNGVLHLIVKFPYIKQEKLAIWWNLARGYTSRQGAWIKEVTWTKKFKNYLTPYLQGQSTRFSSSRAWIYKGWRKEYHRIGTRLWFHYMPCLTRSLICMMSYTRSLYYHYKEDILINSLIPLSGLHG